MEDTDGCAKQYRFTLAVYWMTVLSSLCRIIMYHAINPPGYGNTVVDIINSTYKHYLKGEMKPIENLQVPAHQIL